MRRIKLSFAPDVEVVFVDREMALRKIEEWAEKGVINVQVVFGPEGCGKSAWLRQSSEVLRDLGFDVIYINPVEKEFYAVVGVDGIRERLLEILREATDEAWARAVWATVDLVRGLIIAGRRKIAVLADEVFQAIGLGKASTYVKGLLGLIEYPPRSYERVIAVVATSEGVSRREIGRHRWADLLPMWNMPREGFRQLYDQLPGGKPSFDEVWRLTGGNPKLLAELYRVGWDAEVVVKKIVDRKRIDAFVASLSNVERELLTQAVEDPDVLLSREGVSIMDRLTDLNLIVDTIPERDPLLWAGEAPPEKDLGLGIGRRVAWQTPLHREAVEKALR